MREPNSQLTETLVRALLKMPSNEYEAELLRKSIRDSKLELLKEMDSWEAYGTNCYLAESARDPDVCESDYFGDFHDSKVNFERTLALESTILCALPPGKSLASIEKAGSPFQSTMSLGVRAYWKLVCVVINNNLHFLVSGEDQLSAALKNLQNATLEFSLCGEEPEDYIDYWYETQKSWEWADERFKHLVAVLPTAWENLLEFSEVPGVSEILHSSAKPIKKIERLKQLVAKIKENLDSVSLEPVDCTPPEDSKHLVGDDPWPFDL
jgi:hypothetical protein